MLSITRLAATTTTQATVAAELARTVGLVAFTGKTLSPAAVSPPATSRGVRMAAVAAALAPHGQVLLGMGDLAVFALFGETDVRTPIPT